MADPELVLRFADRDALLREHEINLSHGRAFVPISHELSVFTRCALTLVHPDTFAALSLPCEVVMVIDEGPDYGTALQLLDHSEAAKLALSDFVHGEPDLDIAAYDDEQPEPITPADETDTNAGSLRPSSDSQRVIVEARAQKLRNLTPAQRMQVARSNVLDERVLLERIYGSAVWELLLRNPKVTIPEVARMARKGTMPRPLLDLVADNEQWIRHSLVRRALLANPRLSSEGVTRVLRTLPPRELKLVPQQTAYPPSVRQAATRLMRGI